MQDFYTQIESLRISWYLYVYNSKLKYLYFNEGQREESERIDLQNNHSSWIYQITGLLIFVVNEGV